MSHKTSLAKLTKIIFQQCLQVENFLQMWIECTLRPIHKGKNPGRCQQLLASLPDIKCQGMHFQTEAVQEEAASHNVHSIIIGCSNSS